MGRSLRLLGLLAAVLGTATATGLYLKADAASSEALSPGERQAALRSAVDELDARLRETAAGVHARASTLAELPRLQAAVSTDAATVADLTQDELAFRTAPGEVIAIGQVPKVGKPMTLYRSAALAAEAAAPPLDRAGYHLAIADGRLVLSEVVDVRPRERGDELRGTLVVSRLVEVQDIAARLAAKRLPARLDVGGRSLALGSRPLAAGAPTIELALASEPAAGARLVAEAVPKATGAGRRWGAAGLELLALLAALGLWRRGSASAASPSNSALESTLDTTAPKKNTTDGASTGAAGGDDEAGLGSKDTVSAPAWTAPDGGQGRLPARIGRYQVLRPLGSGGMAEVYLARSVGEAGFEKLVALKVMQRSLAQQPVLVEHFLDEARLAARLNHPNIVQISDLGKADDEYFIAMEFIDGADLDRLLADCRRRGEQVPVPVALSILRKICAGMHAAHVATGPDGAPLELVHRDVKSANVFVAKNGAVKVGDFGIAKVNQVSRVKKTQYGEVKGTAAYMAPEHRMGQPLDRRADLYSVGAIAYELLTATEINLDLSLLAPLGREGWPHLPPPSQVRPELPPELDAIVLKTLSYEREDRYPSCAALEEALDEVATRHGLIASDRVVAQWAEAALAQEPGSSPGAMSETSIA